MLSNRLPGLFHCAAAELLLGQGIGDGIFDTSDNGGDGDDGGADEDRRLKQTALLKSALSTAPGHGHSHLALPTIVACGNEKRIQASEEKEQAYIIISIQRAARKDREEFAKQMDDGLAAITPPPPPSQDHGPSSAKRETATITNHEDGDQDSEAGDIHVNAHDVHNDEDEDEGADEEDGAQTSNDPLHRAGPLGILTLRPAIIDSGYDNVPRSRATDKILATTTSSTTDNEIQILLEDNLLSLCEVGMKLQLVTRELQLQLEPVQAAAGGDVQPKDNKLRVITACTDVRVSFDTFLPQMLMAQWKEPVANTRPPPSVRNPAADVVEDGGSDNGHGGDRGDGDDDDDVGIAEK